MKIIFLALAFLYSGQLMAGDHHRTRPHPTLSQKDVVQIVMNALKNNDQPNKNSGIAITFNFASPTNKRNTGPLRRFNSMIRGQYSPMINHSSATYENIM
jgi:hypothetical protein